VYRVYDVLCYFCFGFDNAVWDVPMTAFVLKQENRRKTAGRIVIGSLLAMWSMNLTIIQKMIFIAIIHQPDGTKYDLPVALGALEAKRHELAVNSSHHKPSPKIHSMLLW
jgi:hypothetical protein